MINHDPLEKYVADAPEVASSGALAYGPTTVRCPDIQIKYPSGAVSIPVSIAVMFLPRRQTVASTEDLRMLILYAATTIGNAEECLLFIERHLVTSIGDVRGFLASYKKGDDEIVHWSGELYDNTPALLAMR